MKTKTERAAGFTLVEIMIVVAIIGLLAAIAFPNWVKVRSASQASACINNLRQIDGAKQQWGLENKSTPNTLPTLTDIQPYMGRGQTGSLPSCPLDSSGTFSASYTIGSLQTAPACNINTTNHVLN